MTKFEQKKQEYNAKILDMQKLSMHELWQKKRDAENKSKTDPSNDYWTIIAAINEKRPHYMIKKDIENNNLYCDYLSSEAVKIVEYLQTFSGKKIGTKTQEKIQEYIYNNFGLSFFMRFDSYIQEINIKVPDTKNSNEWHTIIPAKTEKAGYGELYKNGYFTPEGLLDALKYDIEKANKISMSDIEYIDAYNNLVDAYNAAATALETAENAINAHINAIHKNTISTKYTNISKIDTITKFDNL